MAYIGSTPTSQNFTSGTDYFSGTGSQTAYTLTRTVNSVNDIEVVINNVVQQPSTAYTLSGTTITFTSAPSSGTNNIYVRYLSTATTSIVPSQGTVGLSQLSASGTPSSSNYLRGDNSWASIASSQWTTTGSNIYYNTGSVGVNNTSPAVLSSTTQIAIKANSSADSMFVAQNSNGLTTAKFGFQFTGGIDNPVIGSYTNHPFLFLTNNTEQMRITTDGDFLMAPSYRTTPRGKVDISAPGGTISPTACLAMSRWGDAGTMVNFFPTHSSTTSIGNIYNAGLTSTQYNTSSDYRLKENIVPMTGALAKVALLKPCTYTWKSTGDDSQGFIAHELQEVIPDAVCGEKDAVDADGNIVAQGVDTSFLVATLTAAIQEQQAMIQSQQATIEELTARVTALETE